ncbi:MAG: hypothetical protein ACOY4R_03245 [Pseudomonadota bacterium]
MTPLDEFRGSAAGERPPSARPALEALWWLLKGDWSQAHACVQRHEGDVDCDWVHAHLHRQEGDMANAEYWYRRARRPASTAPLPEEWTMIAGDLLARGGGQREGDAR